MSSRVDYEITLEYILLTTAYHTFFSVVARIIGSRYLYRSDCVYISFVACVTASHRLVYLVVEGHKALAHVPQGGFRMTWKLHNDEAIFKTSFRLTNVAKHPTNRRKSSYS